MRLSLSLAAAALVAAALAGCRGTGSATGQAGGKEMLLVDHSTQLSFRNHVKPVPDPLGGGATVLVGERVSKTDHHMVFEQKTGFFTVPEGGRGAVVVRVMVRKEQRVRVALVSGDKLKSYYVQVPAENQWCELVLPLAEAQAKIPAGSVVNDISMWLKAPEGAAELKPGSEFYMEKIVFRPE